MSLSFWQILLVVLLFILLFGRGKIPGLMADIAAGIKGFRREMSESQPPGTAEAPPPGEKPEIGRQ